MVLPPGLSASAWLAQGSVGSTYSVTDWSETVTFELFAQLFLRADTVGQGQLFAG
jgi:hypothetical protein